MGFSGTFTSTPGKSYQGEITFNSEFYSDGLLVKGSAPGC